MNNDLYVYILEYITPDPPLMYYRTDFFSYAIYLFRSNKLKGNNWRKLQAKILGLRKHYEPYGFNLNNSNPWKYRCQYCSQLISKKTGNLHLKKCKRIKGLPEVHIKPLVELCCEYEHCDQDICIFENRECFFCGDFVGTYIEVKYHNMYEYKSNESRSKYNCKPLEHANSESEGSFLMRFFVSLSNYLQSFLM